MCLFTYRNSNFFSLAPCTGSVCNICPNSRLLTVCFHSITVENIPLLIMWAQTAELSDTQGINKLFLKVYILLLIIWLNLILQSTLKKVVFFFHYLHFILFLDSSLRYQWSYFFFSCWRTTTNCLNLKKYISFGTNCEQKKFPKLRGTNKSGTTWHSLWTLTQPPNISVIRTILKKQFMVSKLCIPSAARKCQAILASRN